MELHDFENFLYCISPLPFFPLNFYRLLRVNFPNSYLWYLILVLSKDYRADQKCLK